MPESFYDTMVVLYFTVVPLLFLSLQVLFSTRKKLIWGFIVPVIWSALGAFILIRGYREDKSISYELLIVFLAGDFILLGLLALCRYLKRRGKKPADMAKRK
jgi:hypothetical protein